MPAVCPCFPFFLPVLIGTVLVITVAIEWSVAVVTVVVFYHYVFGLLSNVCAGVQ